MLCEVMWPHLCALKSLVPYRKRRMYIFVYMCNFRCFKVHRKVDDVVCVCDRERESCLACLICLFYVCFHVCVGAISETWKDIRCAQGEEWSFVKGHKWCRKEQVAWERELEDLVEALSGRSICFKCNAAFIDIIIIKMKGIQRLHILLFIIHLYYKF